MRQLRRTVVVVLAIALVGLVGAGPARAAAPANDNFANAQVITGASGTISGTTIDATGEPNEPGHGDRYSPTPAVNSIWYSWTAPATGPVRFDTCSSGYDTTMAAYTGESVAALTVLAENDDSNACAAGSSKSAIGFVATNGVTYRIAVDGFTNGVGPVTLAWAQPPAPAPANNTFATPTTLDTDANVFTIGATAEPGEPLPAGSGGRTVWLTWTSGVGGKQRLSTCLAATDFRNDIPFDTVVAVYTGTAVGALTPVATTSQACPGDPHKSVVRFPAAPSTTYRIQLSGAGGSMGNTVLRRSVEGVLGDFTGDGKSDKAVYRPSTGQWIVLGGSPESIQYGGAAGDIAVPADITADGIVDPAIFRPSTAQWFVPGVTPEPFQFGQPCAANCATNGDIPFRGELSGDAYDDFGVYRPATGQWFLIGVNGYGPDVVQYGVAGDIPVPADYTGDHLADTAVYRPSTGQWFVRGGSPEVVQYGIAGDLPVPGDYDGDGDADIAIYRPSTGQWFVRGGSPEVTQYGSANDVPQPADVDGNGTSDKAIYRPSTGQWFVRGATPEIIQYGAANDVPLMWPWSVRRLVGFTN